MQPERFAKIRKMVEISKLLGEAEREEWLELMELMNDKQLLELETILMAPANKGKPLTAILGGHDEPASRASLSHIMNLPGDTHGKPVHHPEPFAALRSTQKPGVKPAVPSVAPQAHKPSFKEKLAGMLAEKELPAGKPSVPAGLPAHTSPIQPVPKPAPSAPVAATPLRSLLKLARPKEIPKHEAHLLVEKKSAVAPKPAQPASAKPAGTPLKAVAVSGGVGGPKLPDNAPAKVFDRVIKQQPGQAYKNPSAAPSQVAPQTAASAEPSGPAGKPEDAGKNQFESYTGTIDQISPEDLYDVGMDNVVDFIKDYIRSYGYHDAIFKLEKSPLYQAYIQTGLAALSGKKPQDKNIVLLTREEFEQVADLLGKIRTG